MNRKRRLWLIIGMGIVITLVVAVLALHTIFNCCALPPTPPAVIMDLPTIDGVETFQSEAIMALTQTTAFIPTMTPSPTRTPLPYDPTLYAQRRQEEQILQTAAGPTQYAIFFATETALVAAYQTTALPTFTPIPYDASMSPTALPLPSRTFTPTATLCPPSDVICPGGNATPNAAQIVLGLMASASAPEFGQLAQTATALYVTLTPSPTAASKASNTPCAFMWAHQDLPEIAKAAQEAFTEAKLDAVTVIRADAYGESCGSRFGAMTTDFYLSAEVDNFGDTEAIGHIIQDAYSMLMALDVELPAKHGYLDIVFTSGGETQRFRTLLSQIKAAVEDEASGEAIIEAGGGLR